MKIVCFITASFIFCLISCKDYSQEKLHKTFDADLWREKTNKSDYSFRDEMLEDLVYNIKLKGLTKKEIIAKLGAPDRTNKEYLYYESPTKQDGLFRFQKRYLVLKLKKDNTVEWRKIKN